jgi:predicted amidophosphoribosyltransferase
MSGPRICPHCGDEMDEDLAEEGICSECGEELDS